jgi:hypothetical protein
MPTNACIKFESVILSHCMHVPRLLHKLLPKEIELRGEEKGVELRSHTSFACPCKHHLQSNVAYKSGDHDHSEWIFLRGLHGGSSDCMGQCRVGYSFYYSVFQVGCPYSLEIGVACYVFRKSQGWTA